MAAEMMLCTACGTQSYPKSVTKGSIIVELALWLCFLIPGLLYSVWRLTTRYKGCRACGSKQIIPLSSPMAKQFLATNAKA